VYIHTLDGAPLVGWRIGSGMASAPGHATGSGFTGSAFTGSGFDAGRLDARAVRLPQGKP